MKKITCPIYPFMSRIVVLSQPTLNVEKRSAICDLEGNKFLDNLIMFCKLVFSEIKAR